MASKCSGHLEYTALTFGHGEVVIMSNIMSDKGIVETINGAVADSSLLLVKTVGMTAGGISCITSGTVNGTKRLVGGIFNGLKWERSATTKTKKREKESSGGFFSGLFGRGQGMSRSEVKKRATLLEDRISELYLVIGKLGSEGGDSDKAFNNKKIKVHIEDIEKLEEELRSLKRYLDDASEAERQNQPVTPFVLPAGVGLGDKIARRLKSEVESCVRNVAFPLKSEAILFNKIMTDLFDEEIDIKRLAVSELGKMGKVEVIPVLNELMAFENNLLRAEVLNALVQLNDRNLFSLCKHYISDEYLGIRSAAIRGLYKSGNHAAVPIMIQCLQDESVEVRNSAAMFLGWIGDGVATPSLLQACLDGDQRVRKASLSALAGLKEKTSVIPMIRLLDSEDKDFRGEVADTIQKVIGKKIDFNNSVSGRDQIVSQIDKLMTWYLQDMQGTQDSKAAVAESTPKKSSTKSKPKEAIVLKEKKREDTKKSND